MKLAASARKICASSYQKDSSMMSLRRRFATLLLVLLSAFWLASRAHAAAGAYEAELPAELATARNMCALLPCQDVFPGAGHFSERKGQPPYVEAYDNNTAQQKLLGYVMLSTDITDTPAYSGKPVVTLIGMDKAGHYVGVKGSECLSTFTPT